VSGPELQLTRTDGVLRLVIDRPKQRNALSAQVLNGMQEALGSLEPQDRVVLVASSGDEIFCSGADLAMMSRDATGLELHEARGALRRLILTMRALPLPVVGRVQGRCLAGGVGLALGCDLVVASAQAQFELPEVKRGLWPFMVSGLLAQHVSPKIAMDMMLTGAPMSAQRAAELGLVSRVVDAAELDTQVEALLAQLAGSAPVAMRRGKAAFAAAQETALEPALEALQAQLSLLTQTDDVAEGLAAFFDKREPRWTGR